MKGHLYIASVVEGLFSMTSICCNKTNACIEIIIIDTFITQQLFCSSAIFLPL